MNFMEKGVVMLLVFVLLIGVVGAEDGWGEFTDEEDNNDETVVEDEESIGEDIVEDEAFDSEADDDSNIYGGEASLSGEDSTERTQDFYIALWVGAGALLLFLLLLFLLLKRPRNRWKKKK